MDVDVLQLSACFAVGDAEQRQVLGVFQRAEGAQQGEEPHLLRAAA